MECFIVFMSLTCPFKMPTVYIVTTFAYVKRLKVI